MGLLAGTAGIYASGAPGEQTLPAQDIYLGSRCSRDVEKMQVEFDIGIAMQRMRGEIRHGRLARYCSCRNTARCCMDYHPYAAQKHRVLAGQNLRRSYLTASLHSELESSYGVLPCLTSLKELPAEVA